MGYWDRSTFFATDHFTTTICGRATPDHGSSILSSSRGIGDTTNLSRPNGNLQDDGQSWCQ